jgi:hypothetical protein
MGLKPPITSTNLSGFVTTTLIPDGPIAVIDLIHSIFGVD